MTLPPLSSLNAPFPLYCTAIRRIPFIYHWSFRIHHRPLSLTPFISDMYYPDQRRRNYALSHLSPDPCTLYIRRPLDVLCSTITLLELILPYYLFSNNQLEAILAFFWASKYF